MGIELGVMADRGTTAHRTVCAEEADECLLALLQTPWLLSCHFQPLMRLADAEPVGHEALLRVGTGPGAGTPEVLLDAARRRGRTRELDDLARRLALGRVAPGRTQLLFLNCEVEMFVSADPRALLEHVRAAGLRPDQVVLELVERVRAPALVDLQHGVGAYRAHGFRLALDDVGAGWSSLDLVAALEPDVLKIDREVVSRLPRHAPTCVTSLLVSLARQLGARTVAEGVETQVQHCSARDLGVDWGQGWWYGRPVDPLTG